MTVGFAIKKRGLQHGWLIGGKMTNIIKGTLKRIAVSIMATAALLCSGIVIENHAAGSVLPAYSSEESAYYGFDSITNAGQIQNTLKNIDKILPDRQVYAGGMPFGVKLYTDGLLIIGFADVDCSSGSVAPAKDAGMQVNDIIIKADGKKIGSASDFIEVIEKSGGKSVKLVYLRGDEERECEVTPSVSDSDGKYKTGMWLRDSTAGIGTVTFVIPESGVFAGLGHGICDSETGALVPLSRGITSGVKINGIKKGIAGSPGELKGTFNGEKTGNLMNNTENGVFGIFADAEICGNTKIELGRKEELTEGEAYILCTLDDNKVGKYGVYISEVHPDSTGNKNFIVTVTDEELIKKTGGIVQGMSGSPIIKDGKLIGAITHVLINDPTKGYGIFADNMLAAME